jgi:hypothetical protein
MQGPLIDKLRDNAPRIVGALRLVSILMASVAHPLLGLHAVFVLGSEAVLLLFGNRKSVAKHQKGVQDKPLPGPIGKALQPHKYPIESSAALDVLGEIPHLILGASMVLNLDITGIESLLGESVSDIGHSGGGHDPASHLSTTGSEHAHTATQVADTSPTVAPEAPGNVTQAHPHNHEHTPGGGAPGSMWGRGRMAEIAAGQASGEVLNAFQLDSLEKARALDTLALDSTTTMNAADSLTVDSSAAPIMPESIAADSTIADTARLEVEKDSLPGESEGKKRVFGFGPEAMRERMAEHAALHDSTSASFDSTHAAQHSNWQSSDTPLHNHDTPLSAGEDAGKTAHHHHDNHASHGSHSNHGGHGGDSGHGSHGGHHHPTGIALMLHGAIGVLGHLPLWLFGPERNGRKVERMDLAGDDFVSNKEQPSLHFAESRSQVVGSRGNRALQWFRDNQVVLSSVLQMAIGVTMLLATGMPLSYQLAGIPLTAAGAFQALFVRKREFSAEAEVADSPPTEKETVANPSLKAEKPVQSASHVDRLRHHDQKQLTTFALA